MPTNITNLSRQIYIINKKINNVNIYGKHYGKHNNIIQLLGYVLATIICCTTAVIIMEQRLLSSTHKFCTSGEFSLPQEGQQVVHCMCREQENTQVTLTTI